MGLVLIGPCIVFGRGILDIHLLMVKLTWLPLEIEGINQMEWETWLIKKKVGFTLASERSLQQGWRTEVTKSTEMIQEQLKYSAMVCLRILWHYGIPWYQNVIPCYSCETPCLLSKDTRKRRWRAKSGGRRALTKCIGSGMHTKARESMPAVCCAHGNVRNQLINISITSESFEQTNMAATAFDKACRVLTSQNEVYPYKPRNIYPEMVDICCFW